MDGHDFYSIGPNYYINFSFKWWQAQGKIRKSRWYEIRIKNSMKRLFEDSTGIVATDMPRPIAKLIRIIKEKLVNCLVIAYSPHPMLSSFFNSNSWGRNRRNFIVGQVSVAELFEDQHQLGHIKQPIKILTLQILEIWK